ncbi:hypothetical protein [Streptomyces sp. NPDC005989]
MNSRAANKAAKPDGPGKSRRRPLITAAVTVVLVFATVTFAAMHRPI